MLSRQHHTSTECFYSTLGPPPWLQFSAGIAFHFHRVIWAGLASFKSNARGTALPQAFAILIDEHLFCSDVTLAKTSVIILRRISRRYLPHAHAYDNNISGNEDWVWVQKITAWHTVSQGNLVKRYLLIKGSMLATCNIFLWLVDHSSTVTEITTRWKRYQESCFCVSASRMESWQNKPPNSPCHGRLRSHTSTIQSNTTW